MPRKKMPQITEANFFAVVDWFLQPGEEGRRRQEYYIRQHMEEIGLDPSDEDQRRVAFAMLAFFGLPGYTVKLTAKTRRPKDKFNRADQKPTGP
jgi:hypothetical protein